MPEHTNRSLCQCVSPILAVSPSDESCDRQLGCGCSCLTISTIPLPTGTRSIFPFGFGGGVVGASSGFNNTALFMCPPRYKPSIACPPMKSSSILSMINISFPSFARSPILKIFLLGSVVTQQRWLVVESRARLESDLKQLEKRVAKKLITATSALKQLSSQQFACQPDALQAATAFSDQLPYHQLDDLQVVEIIEYPKRGRPRKDEVGQKHCQISATLIPQPHAMDVEIQRAGNYHHQVMNA